ncbi:LRR receptor-like serine/threonine-protein kinase [Pyrus ussuriensis x Pyrus communis]|uniref:LRR receptor-like serine/threonine-protein kinase n=1 Tax=Pyrus ussuriensis x Pyrus communis TaxID=2448454 RepID=A0A5N5HLE6_9ROSA|nr:LRR receptor-like serine/threonine-protein kinase [Pyrus ussuriensis x Pyrus communis]
MSVIYNLFEEHTVKEISFINWNSPPIYDEYIDEDEDGSEVRKLYSSRLYNLLEDDIVIYVINEILEGSFLNVEHQVKIVDVKETLPLMSEVVNSDLINAQLPHWAKTPYSDIHDYMWDKFLYHDDLVRRKSLKKRSIAHHWSHAPFRAYPFEERIRIKTSNTRIFLVLL